MFLRFGACACIALEIQARYMRGETDTETQNFKNG